MKLVPKDTDRDGRGHGIGVVKEPFSAMPFFIYEMYFIEEAVPKTTSSVKCISSLRTRI